MKVSYSPLLLISGFVAYVAIDALVGYLRGIGDIHLLQNLIGGWIVSTYYFIYFTVFARG